jgi:thiol-disulfide isomerase/thioredoxin
MKTILAVLFLGIPLMVPAQQKKNFVLNLLFANEVEMPKKAVMEISYFYNNTVIIIPSKIEGKKLVFKQEIDEPIFATLNITWQNNKNIRTQFLLPADTGSVLLTANNQFSINFKNQQDLFKNYIKMQNEISNLRQSSYNSVKDINFENRLMPDVHKEIDSIEKHYSYLIDNEVYRKIIDQQKESFLAVIALTEFSGRPYAHQRRKFETDIILKIYDSFTEEMKKLPSMQALHTLLLAEKKISYGYTFPSFTLNDKNNHPVELKNIYGKYTLIDFWANWCTPCRAENPNLIAQYKKYKEKGLVIVSVSIDKIADKALWLDAVKNDGIGLWYNFIDANQKAKQQLNIRLIPSNFLIDKNGKILARDLIGNALNTKLDELFKN